MASAAPPERRSQSLQAAAIAMGAISPPPFLEDGSAAEATLSTGSSPPAAVCEAIALEVAVGAWWRRTPGRGVGRSSRPSRRPEDTWLRSAVSGGVSGGARSRLEAFGIPGHVSDGGIQLSQLLQGDSAIEELWKTSLGDMTTLQDFVAECVAHVKERYSVRADSLRLHEEGAQAPGMVVSQRPNDDSAGAGHAQRRASRRQGHGQSVDSSTDPHEHAAAPPPADGQLEAPVRPLELQITWERSSSIASSARSSPAVPRESARGPAPAPLSLSGTLLAARLRHAATLPEEKFGSATPSSAVQEQGEASPTASTLTGGASPSRRGRASRKAPETPWQSLPRTEKRPAAAPPSSLMEGGPPGECVPVPPSKSIMERRRSSRNLSSFEQFLQKHRRNESKEGKVHQAPLRVRPFDGYTGCESSRARRLSAVIPGSAPSVPT